MGRRRWEFTLKTLGQEKSCAADGDVIHKKVCTFGYFQRQAMSQSRSVEIHGADKVQTDEQLLNGTGIKERSEFGRGKAGGD